VSLPHSKGGVWHQDLQRNVWPPALNVAIYLDEVTELNGPTLVVPGTHVLPHPEFDRALQPRQTAVLGPAGSVAVFFATIWHRGAANSTDAPRRAFFCYYQRADAIRIRGAPDPAPGEGWRLASAD
jgi:ectoine hydroxylase-related dioxygenase (phytanoyl-CoA dioxygenase family)